MLNKTFISRHIGLLPASAYVVCLSKQTCAITKTRLSTTTYCMDHLCKSEVVALRYSTPG